MKSLLMILCLLSVGLVAGTALAGYGTMGLYADPDATIDQVQASGGQLALYLVAMDPVSPSGGMPDHVRGFEARLRFQSSSDFVMDASFPVNVINVGTVDNLLVGFGEPLAMQGSTVVLATFTIYTSGQQEANIFLEPSDPPSIPGYLALVDQSLHLVPMEPVSGDNERPVFYINSGGPPLENASWGTAKIMYR